NCGPRAGSNTRRLFADRRIDRLAAGHAAPAKPSGESYRRRESDEGQMSTDQPALSRPAPVVFYNDPKVRSIAYQIALFAAVAFPVYGAASHAIENLARARIASGFGFWNNVAGFDISQTLIEYSSRGSTYGRAFWVGLLNTLLVAGLGIVLATIL